MHQQRREYIKEKFVRSGFFLAALLLHLILFLLLATYVIWPAPPAPPINEFKAVAVKTPPPPPQPSMAGDAALNPQFEPQPVTVPVATPRSVIATARSNFQVNTEKVLDQAFNHMVDREASGTGLTAGGSSGTGRGTGTGFGSLSGSSNQLIGYLYDLKQTPDGKPTGMTPALYHQILMKFVAGNWDESVLAAYYKSAKPLYASEILIPDMDAAAGPKAFGLEKEVQPRMWVVWYKGKVAAPSSGNYQFAGFCDDILLVRINGDMVLDGSIIPVATKLKTLYPWPNAWKKLKPWYGPKYGQLRKGPATAFTGGLNSDVDIMIGEEPGGEFNAALYVFDADKTYPLDGQGQPLLPLFQMGPVTSIFDGEHPPISTTQEPWQGVEK